MGKRIWMFARVTTVLAGRPLGAGLSDESMLASSSEIAGSTMSRVE